ncbi:hypothetical protein [Bacillus changyiensis]|uniref:hypothetical protein n=1 Tax=Bacillus changyiensis TaxID=3004103 RepID=UPI0022E7D463|nr:hypothetical protein [Bacillus changyiensis]MDA1478288.1 hypothetical protein [Bacillus changyiensis]
MNENEKIIMALGFSIIILGILSLFGVRIGDSYSFGITVFAGFFTLAEFADDVDGNKKRLKTTLYLVAMFGLIVAPHLRLDLVYNNLSDYTNYLTLIVLGLVVLAFPQKRKEIKQKDKKIRELEDIIEKMK